MSVVFSAIQTYTKVLWWIDLQTPMAMNQENKYD